MDLKFVEAASGLNWGKFAVGRHSISELGEPSRVAPAQGLSLILSRGWGGVNDAWVLDLQTGEGAVFHLGGLASADLEKHRIWVCPLYEPFLVWLYALRQQAGNLWWDHLPRTLELPDAPASFAGYRRPGPEVCRRPIGTVLSRHPIPRDVEQ